MKQFFLVLALCACQTGDEKAAPKRVEPTTPAATGDEYSRDIQKLCDSVKLSGADQFPKGERHLPIAEWLAANLKTPESRQFLVKIQPLGGEPKATALEAEAKRVGLAGCALADEWRVPGAMPVP